MSWREWYDGLVKPSWTPEPATIGTIWSILYPVILVTFGYVFVEALRRVQIDAPIVIRLDGTNADEGREILQPHLSDQLQMQPTMLAAAATAVELANR